MKPQIAQMKYDGFWDMDSFKTPLLVFVTAPDADVARRIARAALQARTAACANLLPAVESHYWWRGNLESSSEVLIIFKTREDLLRELEALVIDQHPYDTPEFVAVPVNAVNAKYLSWWHNALDSGGSTGAE